MNQVEKQDFTTDNVLKESFFYNPLTSAPPYANCSNHKGEDVMNDTFRRLDLLKNGRKGRPGKKAVMMCPKEGFYVPCHCW